MESKNNQKNKIYTYICYYCIEYTSNDLSDMIKHFKRKKKCRCNNICCSYEDANILSRRKYCFNFDNTNLMTSDYLFIIQRYHEPVNYIESDFRTNYKYINQQKESENKKNHEEKEKEEKEEKEKEEKEKEEKEEKNNELINLSFVNDEVNSSKDLHFKPNYINDFNSQYNGITNILKNILSNNTINESLIENIIQQSFNEPKKLLNNYDSKDYNNDDIDDLHELPEILTLDILNKNINNPSFFTKMIDKHGSDIIPLDINNNLCKSKYENVSAYNLRTKKFFCNHCKADYAFISTLRSHYRKDICSKRKKVFDTMTRVNKSSDEIVKKEELKNAMYKTFVNNNHLTNINNIQNNNNANNNTNNNTYHLDIKDFIHDRYDLSHINEKFYEQKDFFLFHNFLRAIMENEKNHNIFFSGNDAIIYSDKELNRMSSDKAGFMILDKLSQSADQLLLYQTEETRKCFDFIQNYYRIVKGQYKHDTISKIYDIDKKQFVYTSNSRDFRSRDTHLCKIISTLNECKNNTRERMMINLDQINEIQLLNPSIEDFASAKMRYRDLRDK